MRSVGGGEGPQAPSPPSLTYPITLTLHGPLSSSFKEKGEDDFMHFHTPHSTYSHPDREHSTRRN
jgi:hypothetical protein